MPFSETPPLTPSLSSLSKLESAIQKLNRDEFGWSLCFVGENQADKLLTLIADLRLGFSATGDGKKFASGFSYWGLGPTIAWVDACQDAYYKLMQETFRTFPRSWTKAYAFLNRQTYHYVSLGVGDGQKDRSVLTTLGNRGTNHIYYFPVDMSAEMLRFGIREVSKAANVDWHKILPIQADFSIKSTVDELKLLFREIVDDQPILFSLLGNTLANFEDDTALLKVVRRLLRPQDRLLLEIACTDSLESPAPDRAAQEYQSSEAFRKFAASSLLQFTDLHIDGSNIFVESDLEPGRSIRIKTLYRNTGAIAEHITLPDGPRNSPVEFPPHDTIRLILSRKYTDESIRRLISSAGFVVSDPSQRTPDPRPDHGFRTCLFLLELAEEVIVQDGGWDIFLAYASHDIAEAEKFYTSLSLNHSVYLDKKRLRPGQVWPDELRIAQSKSLATVILISDETATAHYQKEEIAAAIRMSRTAGMRHYVIPIYLSDDPVPPYGLEIIPGFSYTRDGGHGGVVQKIFESLASIMNP